MVKVDVDDMLQGLDDARVLSAMRAGPSPIQDLLNAYKQLASTNADLPQYADDWTGRDLKDALLKLPAEQQLELILTYEKSAQKAGNVCQPFQYSEPPSVTDERRLKHWLIKLGAATFVFLVVLLVGVMIPVAVMTNRLEAGPVVTQLLNITFEIAKLLFAAPGAPISQ